MHIFSIETGNLMLDGGAMFGVVPKVLWNKVYPADENNLINLSMRALLVVDGNRKVLIDTGMGTKQDQKFLSYYYLNGDKTLDSSLNGIGVQPSEITDVILTHLHFDHCGGSVKLNTSNELALTFPNASYWVSRQQWDAAIKPNVREKASYLKENFLPLQEQNVLKLIDSNYSFSENIQLRIYSGHTQGQIIPFIKYKNATLVYVADLIPSVANIPLAWITAYDMDPSLALKEKEAFLNEAVDNKYLLFFEHDIFYECCTLQRTNKGIRDKHTFNLQEIDKYL